MANQVKIPVSFDIKKQDLTTLKNELQALSKLSISDVMKFNDVDRKTAQQTLNHIKNQAEHVKDALEAAFNVKLNSVNLETFNKNLTQAGSSMQKVYQTFKQGGTAGENAFRSLTSQVLTTNVQLKQTHKWLDNIATTLANTIKWNVASSAVNTLSNSVQQAWGYVKSLDTSLNDIRIVTGKSADEMANFAIQANEAAKSLGKTTVDYTKAALIYAQQGLTDDEIATRAAITLKAANVTGQSADEVSEQLTSVWNGYKVTAEQTQLYIDRLAAVAANTASDLEELSTGMSKVAAAAAAMGVGEDQLAAQLSTIISVTRQAPESVGTALRTVYARISDIKAGIDEDGVSLGNYSGKMAALGFNVLDVNGKLRDMGQVIEEIGGKWQTLTREQQVSLAQTMAGQRQYSNLIALFDNFQEYNRALNIAQNAAGTLQEQQDTYLESTRAHLNQLKASVEDLYDSLINPDSLEPLIDGLAKATQAGAKFVDALGGGGTVLASLGGIAVNVFSDQLTKGITTFINNLQIAKTNINDVKQRVQQLQNVSNFEGLDPQTRQLINVDESFYTRFANNANAQQYGEMRSHIIELTNAINNYKSTLEETKQFDEVILRVQKTKQQFTSFNQVLNLSETEHQKFMESLEKQRDKYDRVSDSTDKLIEKLVNIREEQQKYDIAGRKSLQLQQQREQAINTQIQLLQKLKESQQEGFGEEGFEQQRADIDVLIGELEKLKGQALNPVDFADKLNEISQKFHEMSDNTTDDISIINDAVEQYNDRLKRTKQQVAETAKSTKTFFDNLKTEQAQQAIGRLVGSFTQLGAAVNQIKNSGEAFANRNLGQGITNLTSSLLMLIPAAIRAGKALQTLKLASSALSGGIFVGVAAAALGATAAIIKYADARNEIAITNHKNTIQEENDKQQQIQKNRQLYSSIEQLNKKYQQGQITRSNLKSSIEDLIDQYDLEGVAVDRLRANYDNLTTAMKQAEEEAAKQGVASARREKSQAQQLVLKTAKGTVLDAGRQSGNNYILDLSPGANIRDEPEYIKKLFEKSGAHIDENGNMQYQIDFSTGSIVDLYDIIQNITKAIQTTDQLTDAQRQNSEYYKDAVKWLQQMNEAVEKYRDALEDISRYSTELTAITSSDVDLTNIETTNDYLRQRAQLIKQIQQMLDRQGDIESNAADMADAYIRENYRNLYVQYDQARKYIEELRNKFRSSDKEIENLISKLDQSSLNYLKNKFDLDNISNWKQLKSIIEYLTNKNNADRLIELSNAITPSISETAQSNYDLYSSLSNQIKGSKKQTISQKEFEKLNPIVQDFFTLMANGQYKMTGDAKEFYETVNNLSLQGFKDNINNIIKEQQKLKTILSAGGQKDYLSSIKESLNHPETLTANSQIFDLLSQQGYDVVPWMANLDYTAINEMKEALAALEKQGIDFTARLRELDAELYSNQYAIFSSADNIKELHKLYNDAEEDLKEFGATSEQTRIIIQAYNAALIQLNEELDLKTLDTTELENFANHLQDIAEKTEDLNNKLKQNDQAAEIVAKSIMKMNDGFDLLGKNWDDWVSILQNSTDSSEQFANAMQGARQALAQLLDISKEYVTSDFVKQHLDLITEASNGSVEALDKLKTALTSSVVDIIIDENSLENLRPEIESLIYEINTELPDIQVGTELANDDVFVSKLQDLVNLCGLTTEQINALFDTWGFEPTFVMQPQQVEQDSPIIYTRTQPTGRYDKISFPNASGEDTTLYFPETRQYSWQDGVAKAKGTMMVPALSTDGSTPKINSIIKKATSNFSNYSPRNAGGSATPKKQTKTKQVKPDTSIKETKKPMQDNRDIYHDINLELEQISRNLNRVQKQQDRLYGKQLIDNLNKQSQILEQHKAKLKEKQLLQKQDLELKAQQLRMLGVLVNTETGNIDNYLQSLGAKQGVINGLIAQYNSIVGSYNATTNKQAKDVIKDQLTEIERAIKDAETDYKNLESKIKNYDSLRKAYEDITDTIEEQLQKQIEINITKFKMQVEIRLEMGEAEREWNKFKKEVLEGTDVLKDTGFDSLLKGAIQNYRDVFSYFDIHGNENGEIQSLTKQVTDTLAEIAKIENGQESTYGDNMAQAMEDLNNYASLLQNSMIDVKNLVNQVDQAYLDMYDDIKDQMDKQIEDYEFLNGLIEHDMDLLQLLYGDKQFEAMNSYYDEQHRNQLNQIEFLRESVALVKKRWQLQEAAGNTNAAEKLKQQYKDLVQDMNALVEDAVRTLQDKYTNAINQIFDSLDKRVTGGLGTNYLQMEWELINKNADEYLDTINSAFALQELQTKFQKAIDDTQNVKNQQVLTNLMEEQLSQLRAKDKLTQYDVDRAEKLLEIEQARMALEDARSAKTSLRLKRDSQGNYSYVYAANEEDVSTAQDQLAKAQNDLYNFDKEAYRNNLNDMLSAWKDFQSRYKEIVLDTSLTEEERVRQLALLREQYGEYINNKAEENEVIRTNLMESAFMDYATLYENDYNVYANMIESEKDILMSELVPTWDDGIQQMINKFTAEGGFIPTCEQAFRELDQATIDYENQLDILESVAGANFKEIKEGALDPTTVAFQELIDKNSDLINKIRDEQIPAIEDLKNTLDSLLEKYKAVWEAAEEASRRAHEALQNQRELAAQEAANASKNLPETAPINNPTLPAAPKTVTPTSIVSTPTSTINQNTTPTSNEQILEQTLKTTVVQKASKTNSQEMYKNLAGAIYWGLWGSKIKEVVNDNMVDVFGVDKGTVYFRQAWKIYSQPKYHPGKGSALFYDYSYEQLKKKYKNRLSTYTQASFDTGGYTGSWGSEGKLAILHQKELVLNAHDTQNLLDSVSVLRSIVSKLGGNISARLDGLKNNAGLVASAANQIDQNVNIQASFPNVNSKKEIEEAFSELVNLAAQRASKIR